MNEWMHECMKEWMNEWMDKWMNEWIDEWMNEWMNEWMDEWMNDWMHEGMNEWMDEWMSGWMDGWMSGWMNEWMNGWMSEWMDGWMNEWMVIKMYFYHSFRDNNQTMTGTHTQQWSQIGHGNQNNHPHEDLKPWLAGVSVHETVLSANIEVFQRWTECETQGVFNQASGCP